MSSEKCSLSSRNQIEGTIKIDSCTMIMSPEDQRKEIVTTKKDNKKAADVKGMKKVYKSTRRPTIKWKNTTLYYLHDFQTVFGRMAEKGIIRLQNPILSW